MLEEFGISKEYEKAKSGNSEKTPYVQGELNFKKEERKDKVEAEALLIEFLGSNTNTGNHKDGRERPRISLNTLQSKPHGNVDDNTVGMVQNVWDHISIQRREDEYLAQYEKMNEGMFNSLFSGKEELGQGQLGDCYLVSGILELANAQHFDTLIRTSIQRVKWRDDSGSGYIVMIPLGEPTGRKIFLKDSELNVAKIRGNIGYKLLELAYAKNRRPNNSEGNKYRPITSSELKSIEGGWTKEVLETFLGKYNISFNTFGDRSKNNALKSINQSSKDQIIGFLKHYTPQTGRKFVSLSSIGGESDSKQYTVGGKTIYHKHAYSLTGVKKDSKGDIKSITILNPWNSQGQGKNYQDFTLDEFFKAFSYISCGTINMQCFLDKKSMA